VSHAAPELLLGDSPSVRSDIYAFGSTLFQVLTGRVAFELSGDAHIASLYRRIEQDPVPPLEGVPAQLAAIVERAMAKSPAERFATAAELGEALQAVQRSSNAPVTAMPLPVEGVAQARDLVDTGRTVDDATPHLRDVPGDDANLTRTVSRADRTPAVVAAEGAGGVADLDGDGRGHDGPATRLIDRLPPRGYLVGAAAIVVAVLIGVLLASGGDDDPVETAATTGPTTVSTAPATSTTLSASQLLAADLPLIKQFWADFAASRNDNGGGAEWEVMHAHPDLG